jgi:nucleoside-diphosphate kinase
MNKTLVIIKPDGVERSLIGRIVSRFEDRGFKILKGRFETISTELANKHYAEHADKPFFNELVSFITRSPSFVFVVEGPEETWSIVRSMMGKTNPAESPSGTIRGDFATELSENVIHGSDSAESAVREIGIFFPDFNLD